MKKNKKPLNALKLWHFLNDLFESGHDLENITLLYRYDRNSDEEMIYEVEEDLFDAETNNTLETIMFLTDPKEL